MHQKHNKEQILAAGAELLRRRGYHATGINDVLKLTGISKGSFYNFFTNKEDFGQQAISWYGRRQLAYIRAFLRDPNYSPLVRLKRFYQEIIDVNQSEHFENGCLVNNLSLELAGQMPGLAHNLDHQFSQWVHEIAHCIREGQELGEISQAYSATELADFLHTTSYGVLSRMKATRSKEPFQLMLKMGFALLQP